MSRRNCNIPEDPKYDPEIPELLNEDLASATGTFNPLFQRIINNTHAIFKLAEKAKNKIKTIV